MAENVGGADIFGSGGHAWRWGSAPVVAKEFQAIGMTGAARMVLAVGAQPCTIEGGDGGPPGGPAVLKAGGATKALADSGLDALEGAIDALKRSGEAKAWEDDRANSGSNLVVVDYTPAGGRHYARVGETWSVWQFYRCLLAELAAEGG